jgi:tripartite-type tricarboxylate transporter receptor subunit TctC
MRCSYASLDRVGHLRACRRCVLACWCTLAWAAALGIPALAQDYPSRPVHLVVPFPPGGPTDIVARPLAQFLTETLKQGVVVENKGGAGGAVGALGVARSPPDGYTLLMATVGTHAINAALYRNLAYDPAADFTPIALVAAAPVALVVHPSVPANSIPEFLRLLRARPGELNFGTAGQGTPGHLTAEMFQSATGVKLKHVPYRGSAPAVNNLLGGQIQVMFDPVQSVLPQVQSGTLKILGVSSAARLPVLPDVRTFAESGLADFEATAWWAVFGPAKLPEEIAARLNSEIDRISRSEALRQKLSPLGVQTIGGSREQLAQFQQQEIARWGKAVKDSGVTID